jgi:hypothetical protein
MQQRIPGELHSKTKLTLDILFASDLCAKFAPATLFSGWPEGQRLRPPHFSLTSSYMPQPGLLHVIAPHLGSQAERQSESLQHGLKTEFDIETHQMGTDTSTLRMPHTIAILRRRSTHDVTLIHAFGHRAMTVAAMAFGGPILYTPADESPRSSAKWVRAVNQSASIPTAAI